ncbi:MAG: VTT domain-containing protein [Planctomycetota bacterium]|nr:VTT domain-containing protein [Planctomycetota bacterium]
MKSEGQHLFRLLLLVAIVLAIPILPFLGFGEALEARMTGWLSDTLPPTTVAMLVIGLLASDIFLPVPSSVVSTFAGKMLGFWAGTAATWCGLTSGAVFAFWLVRVCGRPLAKRLSSDEELARMDALAARFGVLVLVLTRPVPVLAEASVLLMGTTRLAWWRFLLAVGLSNLGLAAVYALLGDRVQLPYAAAAALALPLLAAILARWCWRH